MSSDATAVPMTEESTEDYMEGTMMTPSKLTRDNCVLVKNEDENKPKFKTVKFSPSTDMKELSVNDNKKKNKRKQTTPTRRPGRVSKVTSPEVSNIQIKTLFRGAMSDMRPLVRVMFDITTTDEDSKE